MPSSLTKHELEQWTNLASQNQTSTPPLQLATGIQLSLTTRDQQPGLTVSADSTVFHPERIRKILTNRFRDPVYYDNCIPFIEPGGKRLIWYPLSSAGVTVAGGVQCLLDLIGLHD